MNLQERMRERERQIDRCKNSKNLPKENVYWFNENDWTWLISQIELLNMTLMDNNHSDFQRNYSRFLSLRTKTKRLKEIEIGEEAILLLNNDNNQKHSGFIRILVEF